MHPTNQILRLIQKKFPILEILDDDYNNFIAKIENILIDIIIKNHINTILNERLLPSIHQ